MKFNYPKSNTRGSNEKAPRQENNVQKSAQKPRTGYFGVPRTQFNKQSDKQGYRMPNSAPSSFRTPSTAPVRSDSTSRPASFRTQNSSFRKPSSTTPFRPGTQRAVYNEKTSWGKVADWYDEYLENEDSYQKQVILPNLMRVLDPKPKEMILDIACGQGFFTEEIAVRGADVIGFDISPELVKKAESKLYSQKIENARVFVGKADDMNSIPNDSIDNAVCVLASQNIEHLDTMFKEAARVLKRAKPQDRVGIAIKNTQQGKTKHGQGDFKEIPSFKGGRLILVINHPSFRIPKESDWHFEEQARNPHQGKQGRVVYQYLSEGRITIDMNPGIPKERTRDKVYTVSYHRPLQVFVKWLTKHGFAITRIEEWASHKKSEKGPRSGAEDTARKEIPLFMCIEASLLA